MDSNIENELLEDFKSALSNINFQGYNPNSVEFLNALFIGQMWKLLKDFNCENNHIEVQQVEHSNDDIQEELFGAKKYLQKYLETKDNTFAEMSKDELKHVGILIKKAYSKLPSNEERAKLKEYETELNEISKQLD